MKYTITDIQLEKVVFLYLDMIGFIETESDNRIYFYKSEKNMEDKKRTIVFNKESKECAIDYALFIEVKRFFSINDEKDEYLSGDLIAKWVEKTLGEEISDYFINLLM